MQFVHLHVHTHYSLLDGLTKIDELVQRAKEENAQALAITDHGVMYGAVEFYQKCKKAGIKPIIGLETYLAPGSRLDKITKEHEKTNYHLLLLAKNSIGYKNLLKLTTIAHLEGYYYKPRVDWEVLSKYHEGIIACSACLGGEIPVLIKVGKLDRARERILEYNQLFGKGNYYLELMHHPEIEELNVVNDALIKFSRELDIPLVATNDVHYLNRDDDEAQDILLCLQNKKKKDDTDRMIMTGPDFSFRSSQDMAKAFAHVPDAIENTVKIAEECNIEIELGKIQLPFYEVPSGFDGDSYLEKLCRDNIERRYGKSYDQIDTEIKKRLSYELSIIKKMNFSSYFLITADFVNWAKEQGIVVGPGRGSGPGSLVCYLTNITNLDPIKHDLLFERFLNMERVTMPDFDLDFADTRREEVIRYVENKYGEEHVSQIATFGTMAARAAIRDVGRVLGVAYDYCDRLAKMIPMFTKIDKALEIVPELKKIYQSEAEAKRIIDFARRLEGVARHISRHACGVLITDKVLTEYTPIQYASSSDRTKISQYSVYKVEDLGLLKIDFLGLSNLTVIESALKIMKNTRGEEIDIDNIPPNDKKTYKLFQDGETTGVFQFESSGMKRYLKELAPTEFEDIVTMVSLYRPGPMEWIPDYIAGKHGKKKIKYLHPILEPILKKTYGVAIYQEQIMKMGRDLAGFTLGESDILRRAIGKKKLKLLEEQKAKFIDGCVKNGINSELAKKIFTFIEPFAGYGFNRSHAVGYATIAYQTAYLKAHYPTEFMAALLTADQQNTDRIAIEIEECKRMGIEVKQPDVNQSYGSFTVVTSGTKTNTLAKVDEKVDTIRFGLKAIKNIGEHIADVLIEERKMNGPFESISDLLERITDKDMNKKSLEAMIKSGALDDLGERGQLLSNLEHLLIFNKEVAKTKNNGQSSLFADAPQLDVSHQIKLDPAPEINRQQQLSWEKELLGLYISEHPFTDYKKYLSSKIVPIQDLDKCRNQQMVSVAGIISKIKKIITRTNKSMLFAKIEDDKASTEILVFPNLLETTANVWVEGRVVYCQGKVSDKDQDIKILANSARLLDLQNIDKETANLKVVAAPANKVQKQQTEQEKASLKIIFSSNISPASLATLKEVLKKHPGDSRVVFVVNDNGLAKTIVTEYMAANTTALIQEFKDKITEPISVKS